MAEIEEAFIYGDSLESTLVVIVFPNEAALRKLAAEHEIDLEGKTFA